MVKQKSQLEKYKYPALVISGTIIAALLLGFFVTKPMWDNMQKTLSDLDAERNTLSALETKLENLKSLKSKEAELKEKNAKTLAALPEDKDVSRLFVQFENVATQNGLTVKQVSEGSGSGAAPTTQDQTSPNAVIVPVTYQLTGNGTGYDSVKNTLANFEKALRLVSVTSVDITSNPGEFIVNLSITTYKRGAK